MTFIEWSNRWTGGGGLRKYFYLLFYYCISYFTFYTLLKFISSFAIYLDWKCKREDNYCQGGYSCASSSLEEEKYFSFAYFEFEVWSDSQNKITNFPFSNANLKSELLNILVKLRKVVKIRLFARIYTHGLPELNYTFIYSDIF